MREAQTIFIFRLYSKVKLYDVIIFEGEFLILVMKRFIDASILQISEVWIILWVHEHREKSVNVVLK